MTVCLFGGPKFVCKMIPVRQLDVQFLFQEAQNLISTLQNVGEVVAIICDGNRNILILLILLRKTRNVMR